jgi:hypothetical protein
MAQGGQTPNQPHHDPLGSAVSSHRQNAMMQQHDSHDGEEDSGEV